MDTTLNIVECKEIVRSYGPNMFTLQIDDYSIKRGSITGLLGPNGSGKSTFIKLLLNLKRKDSGTITINGIPCNEKQARAKTGYLPEDFLLFDKYAYFELLQLMTRRDGKSREEISGIINGLIDKFAMQEHQNKKTTVLSKGMKQLFGLIKILAEENELLVLDEPFNGLDPVQRERVIREILDYKENKNISILITSHILTDMERLCDIVSVINNGRIMETLDTAGIKNTYGTIQEYYYNYHKI